MSEHLERRIAAHTYHRPSPEVQAVMGRVRASYMALVTLLDGAIPECREKSLAFTALEEAAMWSMKALALTDPEGEVVSPPS
jgi:hypothetical protein